MDKRKILKLLLKEDKQITRNALATLLKTDDPIEECKQAIKNLKHGEIIINNNHLETKKIKTKTKKTEVRILKNYTQNEPLTQVSEISTYFNNRYNFFRKQLQGRLTNTLSISHLGRMQNEKVSLISIVSNKTETKNGNLMLELEDPTGQIRAIATRKEVIEKTREVVLDEVIGVNGSMGNGILFINDIMWPDLPIRNEYKKINEEVYAVFLSDTHVGSKQFLREKFENLIDWIRGKNKLEPQKDLASKIKYIFLAGDVVDGVGVYPRQDEGLDIKDITEQYEAAAQYFKQVPKNINIIISPGNHDYLRGAQPQPPLNGSLAEPLSNLDNITLVSNPALVNIHGFDNNGLDILIYHGVSIDSMVAADPTLKDGYTQPAKVMKSLLKRRHLSPPYETGLLASGQDSLVIDPIPDIFHSGHVHANGAMNYRGVTMINSGTWQAKTDYQRLCGHEPTPCLLPLVNLKTRELTMIDFNK